jgi:hypothetical protein
VNGPSKPRGRAKRLAIVIPLVLILAPIAYSAVSAVVSPGAGDPVPFLEMPDEKYETCVLEKDAHEMRYHHFDLLKRMRDRVLREGDRTWIQFDDCKGCHTSRERFCNRCHDRVNLTPDCFGCHHYE